MMYDGPSIEEELGEDSVALKVYELERKLIRNNKEEELKDFCEAILSTLITKKNIVDLKTGNKEVFVKFNFMIRQWINRYFKITGKMISELE